MSDFSVIQWFSKWEPKTALQDFITWVLGLRF